MQRIPWQVVLISASQRVLCSRSCSEQTASEYCRTGRNYNLRNVMSSVDSSRTHQPKNILLRYLYLRQEGNKTSGCRVTLLSDYTAQHLNHVNTVCCYQGTIMWWTNATRIHHYCLMLCLVRNPPCSGSCIRSFSINQQKETLTLAFFILLYIRQNWSILSILWK